MPWVGLEDIPSNYVGKKFLSSTCAGNEFINFYDNRLLDKRFDTLTRYKHKVSYIGGLSWERIDFELVEKTAKSFPQVVFLFGVKSDGLDKTEEAKEKLLKEHSNVRIWEDLNYKELAALVSNCDVGIIPYRISGQNLRICPNKFFEYSALGKDTITTSIPSMSRYSPPSRIAKNHQSFIQLLDEGLNARSDFGSKARLREISEKASAKETLKRISILLNIK
tara:strand:- start:3468 stop:4133 length:666 start_codon:yes stop_codon:yes gene_type:complete